MLPETPDAPVREMRIHGAVVDADLPRLVEYLEEVVTAGAARVVIDLSTCPSLTTEAISALVAAQHRVRAMAGVIELRGTPEGVRGQLRDAGVDTFFVHSPAKGLARVVPLR